MLMNTAGPRARARIEIIEPLDRPSDYGGDELLVDLLNRRHATGSGPRIDDELAEALRQGDQQRIDFSLPELRDWFKRQGPDYRVLDEGESEATIPFLFAGAPNVEGAKVTASQEASSATGGELSFKVAGNGLGASAKVTVTSGTTLTSKSGEGQTASVVLPIAWQLRARPSNEDDNWLHTEVASTSDSSEITVGTAPTPVGAKKIHQMKVDTTSGGSEPTEISRAFAVDTSGDFSVGLKIGAIGLDTTLKVSASQSFTTKLVAALPSHMTYEIAWLGGPWGISVVAL